VEEGEQAEEGHGHQQEVKGHHQRVPGGGWCCVGCVGGRSERWLGAVDVWGWGSWWREGVVGT
jgi:hypothetical protein